MEKTDDVADKEKKNTGTRAVKASFWFAFCSVVQKGIQFFTVPLFTRLLSTEQYGQYSMYQSWMSLISIFATLNLSAGVYNNALSRYENDRDRYTSSMLGLTTVTVALTFCIYMFAPKWWDHILRLPQIVIVVMFMEILFAASLNFWTVRKRYEFQYKALVVVTLCIAICNPTLGFIGIFMTEERGVARIISTAAVNIAFGFALYAINMFRGKKWYVKIYWKYALAFNIPLIPHYLSQIALAQSDRIMIENMFGKTEVAIYSVAYNIGLIMNIVISAINGSFLPWKYQHCKAKQYDVIGKVSNILLVGIAGVSLIPILLAPELIIFIAPAEYAQAVWVISPVTISCFFTFVNSFFVDIEFYYEANKFIMLSSTIAGVTNIILNFIFMWLFGYIAAGYTTLVSYLLLSIANYHYMKRVIQRKGIDSKIYNIRVICLISLILCISASACMMLYRLPLIRYLLILVGMFILWIKKDKAIALLKMYKRDE